MKERAQAKLDAAHHMVRMRNARWFGTGVVIGVVLSVIVVLIITHG